MAVSPRRTTQVSDMEPAHTLSAAFNADPGGFWRDRLDLRDAFYGDGEIEPNAAHRALAELEREGDLDAVVTQNVDGLHAAAGSETVVELHGTNREAECVECGRRIPAETAFERADAGELPPRCGACDGVLKPAIVLFGASMPDDPGARTGRTERALSGGRLIATGPACSGTPGSRSAVGCDARGRQPRSHAAQRSGRLRSSSGRDRAATGAGRGAGMNFDGKQPTTGRRRG